ncbi:carbohydrate ABC transporter permease [Paenibacillus eucommiae]|uniref:ABC-type sugar transport system permease subunit n=1 Tax=Paenibacillus eucommiae TaxID=1355755 RepID=A0ABS4IT10_9BACL|nr:sugar ABC transporter permease [Paenibacillus eucommiae]MBP1990707.1 ABC-type sugar transport system permease subunit [Paenibacillus eucommiae]
MKTHMEMSREEHVRQKRRQSFREARRGYMFLLPWLIGIATFVAYPLLYSFYISFHKVGVKQDGSGLKYDFVGMTNYKYAFVFDNVFPVEMLLFMREVLLVVPITVIFALLISIMLNQKFKGRMLFRAVFFLPVIFASGQVLLELFNQGQGSLPFVEQYNVADIIYDVLPVTAADTVMDLLGKFVIILWFSGVQIILFLAAFQTISRSTYEAAQIDGATPWESFWKITFPAVTPFIILNLIYTLIEQSSNPFNPVLKHILQNTSDVKTGYGYASALGWIYFAFIMIPIGILVYIARVQSRKKEEAQ